MRAFIAALSLLAAFMLLLGAAACADECDFSDSCCYAEGDAPCAHLSEQECEQRSYCRAVPGTRGTTYDPSAPTQYVGCASRCGAGGTTSVCVYDPMAPDVCYFVPGGYVPDGFESLFECNIPEGYCGT